MAANHVQIKDKELHEKLKIAAIMRKMKLFEYIELALEEGLKALEKGKIKAKPEGRFKERV